LNLLHITTDLYAFATKFSSKQQEIPQKTAIYYETARKFPENQPFSGFFQKAGFPYFRPKKC
jgi:hypothetical protein